MVVKFLSIYKKNKNYHLMSLILLIILK